MNAIRKHRWVTVKTATAVFVGSACLLDAAGLVCAEGGIGVRARQMNPLRQDSLKMPSLAEVLKPMSAPPVAAAAVDEIPQPAAPNSMVEPVGTHSYDPSGRRDPFEPVLQQLSLGPIDPALPPLQRVGLTEMNLIAVVWGAYGYAAMVQTPDGNGYTVRRGTRIGPNNGVVSDVTEKGIVVQERFTDVYGSKQEREYVKLLHPKESAE
jgi:type IV pilus assembly protein PilP